MTSTIIMRAVGVCAALALSSGIGLVTAAPAEAAATTVWDRVAQCESGGNWKINTGNGFYGGVQFAAGTWDHYKDAGSPADAQTASPEQQIVVAEKVFAAQGPRAWPTCAPRLGMVGPDLPVDDPITPSIPLAEALTP